MILLGSGGFSWVLVVCGGSGEFWLVFGKSLWVLMVSGEIW